jgi:hypothetical protein
MERTFANISCMADWENCVLAQKRMRALRRGTRQLDFGVRNCLRSDYRNYGARPAEVEQKVRTRGHDRQSALLISPTASSREL